ADAGGAEARLQERREEPAGRRTLRRREGPGLGVAEGPRLLPGAAAGQLKAGRGVAHCEARAKIVSQHNIPKIGPATDRAVPTAPSTLLLLRARLTMPRVRPARPNKMTRTGTQNKNETPPNMHERIPHTLPPLISVCGPFGLDVRALGGKGKQL